MIDYDKVKARLRERAIFGTATTEQAADAITALQAELSATQKREHDANVAAMNNLRRAEAAETAFAEVEKECERLRGVLRKRTAEADESDERAYKAETALAEARTVQAAAKPAVVAAIASQISEGLGAVLRKFCDSEAAGRARASLHAMPKSEWSTLIYMLADASADATLRALAEGEEA